MMIQSVVKMEFTPEMVADAVNILRSVVERIRVTKGCLKCSVYQEVGNESLVVFEETWRCDTDLQHHLRSEDYQKVLMVIEMARTSPEIRFNTISDLGGVEIIEEARSQREM
jgi:quinol monooxygenase YgiN